MQPTRNQRVELEMRVREANQRQALVDPVVECGYDNENAF